MTIRRLLLAALGLLALFVVVLVFTFPTDAVVRYGLARVTLPQSVTLDFSHAHLSWSGLALEDVVARRADGAVALQVERLRVRPSLWGVVRGRLGRPWVVAIDVCQGHLEGTLAGDELATSYDVSWRDLELASCARLLDPHLDLAGRTAGTGRVRLEGGRPPAGDGSIELRAVRWKPALEFFEGASLRADTMLARWTLANQRLTVDGMEVHGPDVEATGSGEARVGTPLGVTELRFLIRMTPQPGAHPRIKMALDGMAHVPPETQGPRTVYVGGTLDHPRIGPP